jgi:hypothetical protein
MQKKLQLAKCDMTIQRENGQRERFMCNDEEEFTIKAYKFFLAIWKPKTNRMRNVLLKELTAKLAQFESVKNNPFIESWHDYAVSTTAPEIGDFLKHIGAISVTAQLDEETKVKKFFELKAKELNISDADLEEAIDEQYHNYLNEGTFKRASVKKEAD